jgi:hypothetical protein
VIKFASDLRVLSFLVLVAFLSVLRQLEAEMEQNLIKHEKESCDSTFNRKQM